MTVSKTLKFEVDIMNIKFGVLTASLMLASAVGCVKGTVFPEAGTGPAAEETVTVQFNLLQDGLPESRSSLGSGVESLFTGAVLAAYDKSTGFLELESEIPAEKLGGSLSISLRAGVTYDLYLVGNLRLLGEDGASELPSLPPSLSEIESFSYRLDGGDEGGGLRREDFSEVSRWGIPLCWSLKNFIPRSGSPVDIRMERLFSKVVLTVDHSGIAGTDLEAFVNGSVCVRQSNCLLRPFSPGGSRASCEEDIMEVGDCDASMENALRREYVFYVPENRQGELMPGNTDPADKDMDGVEAACGNSGISRLLTYLEFEGLVSGSDVGLEGPVVYRFFLGRNAVSDFDIERNSEIHVTLGFNPGSVFEPDWKLDSEGLEDSRRFYLSGELAGRLPEGKEIYVRKNRPGTFRLNIDTGEGSPDKFSSAVHVAGDYEPETLTELAWTGDCWAAGHSPEHEPRRLELSELGIEVTCDNGVFVFRVTDTRLFVPGRKVPLKFRLFPGGIETEATIVTAEDIAVTVDQGPSLNEEFFLGQKRSLAFKGFAGSMIYYAALQDDVSAGGAGKHGFNRQWKTKPDSSAPFPACALDGAGEPLLPYQDYGAYDGQRLPVTDRLEMYAFYPNSLDSPGFAAAEGKVCICSEDIHNDGLIEIPVRISKPWLECPAGSPDGILIPVDGKEAGLDIGFYTAEGGEPLDRSDFDRELYELLLEPQLGWDASEWQECVRIADDMKSLCLVSTTLDGRKIEDEFQGVQSLGTLTVSGNPYTGLYDVSEDIACFLSLPEGVGTVRHARGKDFYNQSGMKSVIRFEAQCVYAGGDPKQVDLSEEGPSVTFKAGDGVTYGPSFAFDYTDGLISMTFDESEQVKESSDGEFVPGGLLVPYGQHRLCFGVTNRWDGRRIEYGADFSVSYNLEVEQFTVFSPKRYATIILTGAKNAEYLKRYGETVDGAALYKMLEAAGSNEWNFHLVVTGPSYLLGGTYHMNRTKTYNIPPCDFDVKFFRSSADKWTEELADAVSAQQVTTWLTSLRFHKDGTSVGVTTDDVEITGSRYISRISIISDFLGYIYRDERFDFID